ncbi:MULTISPECIES: hypothetical protein [Pseudomonas]|nr:MULTISPECIES: hypothetical protein [Pseudomonas]MDX9685860.1 hypothetical protein [Pseudomonas protegens]
MNDWQPLESKQFAFIGLKPDDVPVVVDGDGKDATIRVLTVAQ